MNPAIPRTPIVFSKFSGSGNDFIIIDNRTKMMDEKNLSRFITGVCRRRMSIGADGLILVENHDHPEKVDFKWRYFNSDGSVAEMCGNGARCVARFSFLNGIAGASMSFENQAGIVKAEMKQDRVKLHMPDPSRAQLDHTLSLKAGPLKVSSINTGVPHVAVFVDDIDDVDVPGLGREIRFHPDFSPAGTNANFVHVISQNTIAVRTYERGVEDETLACGTGAIACALISAQKYGIASPINVKTRSGGELGIYFDQTNGQYHNIYLEGDARLVYTGTINDEAWQY